MAASRRAAFQMVAALACSAMTMGAAQAQSVADFYRGKTINLIIGTSAGNDYDYRGRLLARFMGKYIPGEPTIVPRNMPGGGGIQAANWVANIAPRDGTVVHMIMQNMMAAQAVQMPGVEFDTRKLIWLGNTTSAPNVINSWHTSGITSIEQVKTKELVVGAPMGTAGALYPALLNAVAGTKFKIVMGYPGGNEVNLAMERGEVNGRGSNSWASWKSTKPDWLRDKKINILVQIGLEKSPDLKDVPLLMDLAKNEEDRAVLRLLSSPTAIGRPVFTTPDAPADRVKTLRDSFDRMVADPKFLAEAQKENFEIDPVSGAELQKIVAEIIDAPANVRKKLNEIIGEVEQNTSAGGGAKP